MPTQVCTLYFASHLVITMTIAVEQENSGAATCHMLPCNIDYEGMAKTHVYFKPILVEDGILASTFRGRGLLAAAAAAAATATSTSTTTTTQEEGEEKTEDDENENVSAVVAKPHLLSIEENKIISKVRTVRTSFRGSEDDTMGCIIYNILPRKKTDR
jgi:hypothetical protein